MFCNLLRVAARVDILKYWSVHHCEGFIVRFLRGNDPGSIHQYLESPWLLGQTQKYCFSREPSVEGRHLTPAELGTATS